MKKTLTATLPAALVAQAVAGGLVQLEDTEVVAKGSAFNNIIPLLAVVANGLLFSSNYEDPVAPPTSCINCGYTE